MSESLQRLQSWTVDVDVTGYNARRAALLVATGHRERAVELLAARQEADLRAILSYARQTGLWPLLLDAAVEATSGTLSQKLRASRQKAIEDDLVLERTIRELARAFQALRRPYAFLKGAWYRTALYPKPWYRQVKDVDVLIPEPYFGHFEKALGGMGYYRAPLRQHARVSLKLSNETAFLHKGTHWPVELHVGLAYDNRVFRSDSFALLANVTPYTGLDGGLTLRPTDHFWHAVLHLARRALEDEVKHYLDVHLMLRQFGPSVLERPSWFKTSRLALSFVLDCTRSLFTDQKAARLAMGHLGRVATGPRGRLLAALVLRGPAASANPRVTNFRGPRRMLHLWRMAVLTCLADNPLGLLYEVAPRRLADRLAMLF